MHFIGDNFILKVTLVFYLKYKLCNDPDPDQVHKFQKVRNYSYLYQCGKYTNDNNLWSYIFSNSQLNFLQVKLQMDFYYRSISDGLLNWNWLLMSTINCLRIFCCERYSTLKVFFSKVSTKSRKKFVK